jgi:putative tryptophan/tyrosine transport system substrate-binding protein
MDRRTFIGSVASGVLIVSLAARAQPTGPVRRIGWLWLETDSAAEVHRADAHLRALGWIEGQNLVVERRFANGRTDLLGPLAEELVRLKVEIIVAEGTIATQAAKKATSSIPIVISRSGDPVRAGLVASLARPDANVTGTSTLAPELDRKRLQLIRELLQKVQRVGELVVPANPVFSVGRKEYEQTYRSLGMQPIFVEVAQVGELEGAVADAAQRGAQALYASADPLLGGNVSLILRAAQKHSLPLIVEGRDMVEPGGLMSYAPLDAELDRQLAVFVDKILRGVKPADLPIQQPTKFELLINLKAARALGISVPQALLLRANEVIE